MQIERYRGDTSPDRFTVTNRSTGSQVNLTGCSFKLTINTELNPTSAANQVYQLTGTIDDVTTGIVTFAPSSVQADRLGLYYYDVEMIDAYGAKLTLVKDSYVFTQDITK